MIKHPELLKMVEKGYCKLEEIKHIEVIFITETDENDWENDDSDEECVRNHVNEYRGGVCNECSVYTEDVNILKELNEIPSLEALTIKNLCEKDLKVIPELTNLKILTIKSSNISSVSGIEKTPSLQSIDIINCKKLTSLDEFEKISSLKSVTIINCKSLTNLCGIQGLKLEKLNLEKCPISSASYISKMDTTALKMLKIVNGNLSSVFGGDFPQLEKMVLSYNKIKDISGFERGIHYPNLKILDLNDNEIKSVEGLSFRNLMKLNLKNNYIEEVSGLFLSELTFCDLSNNRIKELERISLPKITEIKLEGNRIKKIEWLGKLNNLGAINLAKNSIEDISFLKKMESLARINLADNLISDVSPLNDLPSLHYLDVESNKISSISGLMSIAKSKKMSYVNFKGNNLTGPECGEIAATFQRYADSEFDVPTIKYY